MLLNSIKPATGARQAKKRLGRGIGSGLGKTAGRGHKGQKARAGGYHKVGFEGGQMPIQRRVPKLGFRSHIARATRQIRLSEIEKLEAAVIDLSVLKDANLVPKSTKYVKIFASGEISRAVTIKGLRVTRGAQSAIEAVGGKVE